MTIRSIFFDLDNTLWDFNASAELALGLVYERYLRQWGVNLEWREVYERHNTELWRLYREGKVNSEQVKVGRFERTFHELGLTKLPADEVGRVFLQSLVEQTVLFPGAVETLMTLSRSYVLGVITNGFAASQERLAVLGLDKLFSYLITSEAIGVPKPQPAMFLHALKLVGCRPEELVYVGDDYETDVIGAKAASVKAILFNHKGENISAKIPQPDAIIYEFTELMDLFATGQFK